MERRESVAALVERADSTLAELVEALGLEGSSAGVALERVRGLYAEVVGRYAAEVERLRLKVARVEWSSEEYVGVLYELGNAYRAHLLTLSQAQVALMRGESSACSDRLVALHRGMAADLSAADTTLGEPTEGDLAVFMEMEEPFTYLDGTPAADEGDWDPVEGASRDVSHGGD